MTVIVEHNPDGSVTLTVGGWVGPDPERIEAAAKAHEAFHNLHCDDPNCMYWVTHVKFATEVLAAAYPVGPVLTLTAEEWAEVEKTIAAKALKQRDELQKRIDRVIAFRNDALDTSMSPWLGTEIVSALDVALRARGGFDD